jgi:hypothetical protein
MSNIAAHNLRGKNFLEEGVKFMRNQLRRGVTIKVNNFGKMLGNSIFSFFYQFTA